MAHGRALTLLPLRDTWLTTLNFELWPPSTVQVMIPKPPPPQQQQPGSKVSDYVYRFRVLATRHSFKLIYLWAGLMLVGLGLLHHKQKTGGKVQCRSLTHWRGIYRISFSPFHATDTSEDMQPDPEVSRKLVNWIEKLGLDQVKIVLRNITSCFQHLLPLVLWT